jgi:hypothetical protein
VLFATSQIVELQLRKQTMKLFACVAFAVLIVSAGVSATPATPDGRADADPCRSIRKGADRAACYNSQSEAVAAAKRAADTAADSKVKDPLEQMKLDEVKLSKRLQGICRGC